MIRVIYVNQVDVMEQSGQGVREREMVTRLVTDDQLDGYYVGQQPSRPSPIDENPRAHLLPLKKNVCGYLGYQRRLFGRLWKLTKGRSADDTVIFLRYAPAMMAPLYVSKWRSIPLVMRSGPSVYNLTFYRGGVSKLTTFLVKRFSNAHYRQAHKIQVVASKTAERIQDVCPDLPDEKFVVLPCACNPDVFFPIDDHAMPDDLSHLSGRRIVCFVGAILPGIGIEDVIDAVDRVREKPAYRDVAAVIIGGGKLLGTLQADVRDRELTEWVHFTGPQTQQYINQVLNGSHAGVLPWGRKVWDEKGASPTKMFEYLSAGANVVCTRHQDIAFVETQGLGEFCDKDDPADMAEAIRRALDTPRDAAATARRRDYVLTHHTTDHLYQGMKAFWLSPFRDA